MPWRTALLLFLLVSNDVRIFYIHFFTPSLHLVGFFKQKENYICPPVIFLPPWISLFNSIMALCHLVVAQHHTMQTMAFRRSPSLFCSPKQTRTRVGVSPLAKPRADTSNLTGRTGCALTGFSMQICVCINM